MDLRQFTSWCRSRSLNLFAVRRADIESFARDLEARARARATVTRRLCTIAGFYKYAVEEELLEHSPAAPGPGSGHSRNAAGVAHRAGAAGRGLPGATVRARIPSVARSALSGITGKMAASFQF